MVPRNFLDKGKGRCSDNASMLRITVHSSSCLGSRRPRAVCYPEDVWCHLAQHNSRQLPNTAVPGVH